MNKSNLPNIRPEELLNRINRVMNLQSHSHGTDSSRSSSVGEVSYTLLSLPRITEQVKLPQKDSYELYELMCFHDEQFVRAAYYALLRRSPDESGLKSFLEPLRRGIITRMEILARLQNSDEARRYGVRIQGIKNSLWKGRLSRLPLIGYGIRLISALVNLPRYMHRIQESEAFTDARFSSRDYHVDHLAEKLEEFLAFTSSSQHQIQSQLEDSILKLQQLDVHTNRQQEDIASKLDPLWTHHLDHDGSKFSALYVEFENQFRGSRADIKSRQEIYLPYLKGVYEKLPSSRVIDLGCGRGEWLELLTEQGFVAEGADLNPAMVRESQRLGLKTTEMDAISYLKKQKDSSIGAITGFHIIEHIPLNILITLFEECTRVLKPGGMIVFETPNPENILVGAYSFHFDPTHQKPLVPDVIEFIAKQKGFVDTEILRLHKRNEPDYIKHRDIDEILYKASMEQDFSIIGYKPGIE
ncbi:methyltransferase domain-containing protein [Paenibacillus sp. D9]|uniref:methyltransferase domain-containing protein n=1 Tax=Paenibacillus sp. D9 TaxID=665792 RepID=UPI0006766518|nr:methyltransferase domain-containing protein [Paenibacillus sp. D9]